jgi:cytosine/adenosine deaminase-related metal-dependent hydrolase
MNNKRNITIKNAWLCQLKENSIEPIFGNLIIRDEKIHEIQPSDFKAFLKQYPDADDRAYNANGRIITVPLVNFHEHFYSRLAKGLPSKGAMDNFLHILENLWWKLDRALDLDMVYASAQMGVLESIRHGVTYVFDHHASPLETRDSLSVIKKVLDRYGLRGVLCFETSARNGDELAQGGLDEFNHFAANHTNDEIKSMLGLHASFTLKDTTLQKAGQILQNYDAGIHIHLCEDEIDRKMSVEKYRDLPVQRLKKYHLLDSKSILSHGIHLSPDDYATISDSGSAIAYNPDSNLNNAVGLPDFNAAPKNIPILIGTDGMHADIARSMKQLFLLYRHQGNEMSEAFQWIQKIYFDQFKFVRQYFPDFPQLSIGDRADLIIWDYIPPTPISTENFWGHFIYGILEYPIHSVIQNGKFLMENKVIDGEDEVRKKIFSQGERLIEKFINQNKLSR